MGEYVKLHGEPVKLGTCEDLFYVRHSQLVDNLHHMERYGEGNLPPAEYLREKCGWRYRFPFPDEDAVEIGQFDPFERLVFVAVQPDAPCAMESSGHGTVSISCKAGLSYNVNIMVPCPATGLEGIKHSPIPPIRPIGIKQQKLIDGKLWTVVECGWCHEAWRLTPAEGLWLAGHIREMESSSPFYMTIADRIEAGYR